MKSIVIFGKKLPVAVMAGMLILAGAGAAAGVTFAGNIEGEAISKVDQGIVMTSLDAPNGQTNNDLGKVSDDGTKFKFASNVNQGDLYHLFMVLDNRGSQDLNGQITLKIPDPLEVEIATSRTDNANLEIARTSMSTWNFNIDPSESVTEAVGSTSSSYTTAQPVADRNNDGVVDEEDIDFIDNDTSNGASSIGSVTVNADGTVTVTAANGGFKSADEFTYTAVSRVDIIVAVPDDAQPGFYTIKGEIKPAEV